MTKGMNCICHYDGVIENKNGESNYVGGAEAALRYIPGDTDFLQFVQMMEDLCANKKKETVILMKHIVFGVECKLDNNNDYQAMFNFYQYHPQLPLRIWITKHSITNNPLPPGSPKGDGTAPSTDAPGESTEGDVTSPYTDAPRNNFKIPSISSLSKEFIEKYDSHYFQSGGYKWKLSFYPTGNKKEHVTDHVSLYLVILDTASLPSGWEVDVVFKFFLFDHIKDKYVVIEGNSEWKFKRFNDSKTEWGFSYLIPLATFNDPRNGYLVDDACKFGAEVFVSTWSADSDRLSVVKDDINSGKYKQELEWSKVSQISYKESDVFRAGGYGWAICLHSAGYQSPGWMSLYLGVRPNSEKVHATSLLRLRNQKTNNHIEFKDIARKFNSNGSASYWGQQKFIALDVFKDEANGFLVNDKFILEAEVTVLD